jgi:hypothetical protein
MSRYDFDFDWKVVQAVTEIYHYPMAHIDAILLYSGHEEPSRRVTVVAEYR